MKLLIFMHYLKAVLRFSLPSDSIRHFYLHPSPGSFNYHGHWRLMACQILVGVVFALCVSTTDVLAGVCSSVVWWQQIKHWRHADTSHAAWMNQRLLIFPRWPHAPPVCCTPPSVCLSDPFFVVPFSSSSASLIFLLSPHTPPSLPGDNLLTLRLMRFSRCLIKGQNLSCTLCVLCIAVAPSPPWNLEHTQPEGKQL